LALEEVQSDGPVLTTTSLVQRKALADLLCHCHLDANQRVVVVADLAKCRFLEHDKQALLELAAGAKPRQPKGAMSQDYVEFVVYMPEDLQNRFLDPDSLGIQLEAELFTFLGDLGLRRGSEFTYKKMSSVLSVHSGPSESSQSLTAHTKWMLKNSVRDRFLRYARTLPKPPSWCAVLPRDPTKFLIDHPCLYKAVLGESTPCATKINMLGALHFDLTYTCRNGGGSGTGRSSSGNAHPKVSLLEDNGMSQMQTFASFMMSGMKQIQDSNAQMIQQLIHGPARGEAQLAGATQVRLQGLVQDTPRPYHRQALPAPPTDLILRRASSLGPEIEDVPEDPPELALGEGALPVVPAAVEGVVAPRREAALATPTDEHPDGRSPTATRPRTKPSIESIMIAMDERKKQRATHKDVARVSKARAKKHREHEKRQRQRPPKARQPLR